MHLFNIRKIATYILIIFTTIIPTDVVSASNSMTGEMHITIIIFDVTGSMVGKGDGQGINIFDEVKEMTAQILLYQPIDTYLEIIPFGRGVQEGNKFSAHIWSDRDRQEAINFIYSLEATELETWLSYSLQYGIGRFRDLETKLPDFQDRSQQILLITDGRGNGPGDIGNDGMFSIKNLISEYNLVKADYPNLYTRFYAIGEILSNIEIQDFEEAGVNVRQIGRDGVGKEIQTVTFEMNQITNERNSANAITDSSAYTSDSSGAWILSNMKEHLYFLILFALIAVCLAGYLVMRRKPSAITTPFTNSEDSDDTTVGASSLSLVIQEVLDDEESNDIMTVSEYSVKFIPNSSFTIGSDSEINHMVLDEKYPGKLLKVDIANNENGIYLTNKSDKEIWIGEMKLKSQKKNYVELWTRVQIKTPYSDSVFVIKKVDDYEVETEEDFLNELIEIR